MAENSNIDFKSLATEIANSNKTDDKKIVEPVSDDFNIDDLEDDDKGENKKADPKPIDRADDDIVVKKKSIVKKEAKKTPEPDDTKDDLETDDNFDDAPKNPDNFTKLRNSQKKHKKRASELETELENIRKDNDRLKKYEHLFALAESPEIKAKYPDYRTSVVSNAEVAAETYGVEKDVIKTIFEQENVREARKQLDQLVDDKYAKEELKTFVSDFYANKIREQKELESADPKKRLAELRAESERNQEERKNIKLNNINGAKVKVTEDLNLMLTDKNFSSKLWSSLFNPALTNYVEDDIAGEFTKKAANGFQSVFNKLVQKGAELDYEDSRTIAMLVADSTAHKFQDQVIPILLERLSLLEKELEKQTGNANPGFRESTNVDSDTPKGNKTREDGLMDAISNLTKER